MCTVRDRSRTHEPRQILPEDAFPRQTRPQMQIVRVSSRAAILQDYLWRAPAIKIVHDQCPSIPTYPELYFNLHISWTNRLNNVKIPYCKDHLIYVTTAGVTVPFRTILTVLFS